MYSILKLLLEDAESFGDLTNITYCEETGFISISGNQENGQQFTLQFTMGGFEGAND